MRHPHSTTISCKATKQQWFWSWFVLVQLCLLLSHFQLSYFLLFFFFCSLPFLLCFYLFLSLPLSLFIFFWLGFILFSSKCWQLTILKPQDRTETTTMSGTTETFPALIRWIQNRREYKQALIRRIQNRHEYKIDDANTKTAIPSVDSATVYPASERPSLRSHLRHPQP